MTDKLIRIIDYIKDNNLDGVLITSMPNAFYMAGFTGDNVLLFISSDKQLLITDSRYTLQAAEQSPEYQLITAKGSLIGELKDMNLKKLGFEGDAVSCNQLVDFRRSLESCEFCDISEVLREIRLVKAEEELDKIRKAAHIADRAFSHILSFAKIGMTEKEIALEIEFFMRKNGAEGVSFDTIVAAAEHGAMPHAEPGDRAIKNGDCVVMDFGCKYQGYCSDMTRTIFFGEPDEKQLVVYNAVLEAQKIALSNIRVGVSAKSVDQSARDSLKKTDMDKYFTHSLGHGVGVEVHEGPRLSPYSNAVLKSGMVVTVEPGVYIDGFVGVRIEDLVIVNENGCENVTKSSKDIIIMQ
ncbi:MAG: Xaa-Pro peptidase family protein [Eubacteriales bacterium]|nr:Xaa-Pro peptidase family protein [Eubacteriales bacterium]